MKTRVIFTHLDCGWGQAELLRCLSQREVEKSLHDFDCNDDRLVNLHSTRTRTAAGQERRWEAAPLHACACANERACDMSQQCLHTLQSTSPDFRPRRGNTSSSWPLDPVLATAWAAMLMLLLLAASDGGAVVAGAAFTAEGGLPASCSSLCIDAR